MYYYYYYYYYFIYLWDWSGTKSAIIVVIYWPIVPALDDIKPTTVSLCPLLIQHIIWPGVEPGPPRYQAGCYQPNYGPDDSGYTPVQYWIPPLCFVRSFLKLTKNVRGDEQTQNSNGQTSHMITVNIILSLRSRKLRLTTVGDPPRWPRDTLLFTKVDTKFLWLVAVAHH
jgi:hypothetical protein